MIGKRCAPFADVAAVEWSSSFGWVVVFELLAVDVCAAVCYLYGGLPALNVVVDCFGYAVAIGFYILFR